jgi:phosphosulfolactate phosphohydrolase-like enzyme
MRCAQRIQTCNGISQPFAGTIAIVQRDGEEKREAEEKIERVKRVGQRQGERGSEVTELTNSPLEITPCFVCAVF